MKNFSLSLALVAGVVSASYGSGGVYDTYDTQYHTPYHASGYGYSNAPAGYYHQEETDKYSHPNPWGVGTNDSVDRSGWWSQYQQYRPPIVPYKSAVTEPCYATCEGMDGASIQFAQHPGKPVQVQGTLTISTSAETTVFFAIKETGVKGGLCATAQAADEFNPQQGLDKYGMPYTFQDPMQGRIDLVTSPESDNSDVPFYQADLYANLAGEDSIIGRALVMFNVGADGLAGTDDDTAGECCVIVVDKKPDLDHHDHTSYPYPHYRPQPQYHQEVSTQYSSYNPYH